MSRQYRDDHPALDTHLSALEGAAMDAFDAGWDACPPGALCIVRSHRVFYPSVEVAGKPSVRVKGGQP